MSAKNIDDQDFENQSNDGADASYDEPYEGDSAYSEDDSDQWSDDVELGDEGDVEANQPAPKKKTSNITIGIILFVIVIAVFGFMALSGGKKTETQATNETQPSAAIDASAESDSADTQNGTPTLTANITDLKNQEDQTATGDQAASIAAPVAAPIAAVPQGGLMDNPNLVSPNSNAGTAPAPMTAPQADLAPTPTLTAEPTSENPETLPQSATPSTDVVSAIAPTVKPVSDFPTVDSIKKPEADTPVVNSNIDPAPSLSGSETKSVALQTQVTAAQSKIAQLEKQVSDQAAEIAAQKQKFASVSSNSQNDELKAKISDLEAKLAVKNETKPTKIVAERTESVDEANSSVHSLSESKSVKKEPVVALKPKVMSQQWSLKSAGSGKAILANKTTGDLKTVRVGDTVSGLGRIVSISSANSSWVVKGTGGFVSE